MSNANQTSLDGQLAVIHDDIAEAEAIRALEQPQWPGVVNDDTAAWVAGKLVSYDEEEQRIELQAQRLIEKVRSRRRGFEARFLDELRRYCDERLGDHRTRTLSLLTGDCCFRKIPGGVRVVDKVLTQAWADERLPTAIATKVVKTLIDSEIKEHARVTGELPPGVEVVPDRETFVVKGGKR